MEEWQSATNPVAARPTRVLVVDDNKDAGETLTELLEVNGFDVRYAPDSIYAMQIAREIAPDIAILDIGMPVMDGFALAEQLRTACGSRLLLVSLSGYNNSDDVQRARAAGFVHHLMKPVRIADLVSLLHRLLGVRRD